MKSREFMLLIFIALLSTATYFSLKSTHDKLALGEPDLFYHLAISKMTAESGILRVLPQAEDIGWGKEFPEKEFLFHALTGAIYKVGGENLLRVLPPVICLAIVMSLFYLATHFVNSWIAFCGVFIIVFATPMFLFRLYLLRPHILAILIFIWLLIGFAKKSRALIFASALLFALSYHAVYVLFLPAVFLIFLAETKRETILLALSLTLGVVVGLVANPYFPSNILMGVRHLQIALYETFGTVKFGGEQTPFTWDILLTHYSFHIGLAILATAFCWRNRGQRPWALAALFCILLTARSPRASEYALPLVAISSLFLIQLKKRTAIAATIFAVLTLGFANYYYYGKMLNILPESTPKMMAERILRSIEAIPQGDSKVFNFEWQMGSYLLYVRPDLRFVDLLDPTFLIEKDSNLHLLRQNITKGSVVNSSQEIRDKFHAQYAITFNQTLALRLKKTIGFRLLNEIESPQFGDSWVFALEQK